MNIIDSDAIYAIRATIRHYANGGVVLIAVSILALLISNSIFSDLYFGWWNQPVSLRIGSFDIFSHGGRPMTLIQFINDALMALFFFSVGLEIKREVLVGELSSFRHALLPILGAVGGMIVPILLFRLVSHGAGDEVLRGSAIPMATDIAFSLGILALLGDRVPIGLKIFLATLAVADDIGGILVIAVFYAGHLELQYLLYALGLVLLLALAARKGVNGKMVYILTGGVVWFLFLHSGVHPTIAGVIVAFCIPARPNLDTGRYIERIRETIARFPASDRRAGDVHILSKEQINLLKSVESASDRVISPLQDMEDALRPLVNFVILPLFAFANAGVSMAGLSVSDFFQGVSLSVLVGLVFGKLIGIFAFSFIAVRLGWAERPTGSTWRTLAGVSLLGGVGFTVSMFIANLAYGDGSGLLDQAKLGIILGSLIAGMVGYSFLNATLPRGKSEEA